MARYLPIVLYVVYLVKKKANAWGLLKYITKLSVVPIFFCLNHVCMLCFLIVFSRIVEMFSMYSYIHFKCQELAT
jgi:hypothetical protein